MDTQTLHPIVDIDGPRAVTLSREVVAEAGPDFVYRPHGGTCRYEFQGCPDCLVGRALFRAGASVAQLRALDNSIDNAIGTAALPPGLTLTDAARHVFAAVQDIQDVPKPWGEALKAAEAKARQLGALSGSDGAA